MSSNHPARIAGPAVAALILFGAACSHLHKPSMPSMPSMPSLSRHHDEGPSDANILAIMLAANNTDVSYAKLVPGRSQTPAIRDFAARMVTAHTAVNQQLSDLTNRINVTPEENKESLDFRDESTTKRDLMRELEGRTFDSTYIANEITYHTKLLQTLDKELIPDADNAQIKQALMQIRPAVQAHLDHAMSVRANLR